MSLENQLGSVVSRLKQVEADILAIEQGLEIEKANLIQLKADLKSLQEQLRSKE